MIEGTTRDARPAHRFAALDGWRGVSALMIVLLHAPIAGTIGGSPFVRNAFHFVDLFFVLSGFVIAHAFADRLRTGGGVGRFMVSRLKRVYPLHLVMLLLFLAYELAMLAMRGPGAAFQNGNDVGAFFANLTMTHALGFVDRLGWNYPSWSISAELLAYLLFAGLIAFAPRLTVPVLVVTIVVAIAVLAGEVGHLDTTIEWGWLRCLYGFSLGALLRLVVWPRMEVADGGSRAVWTIAEAATMAGVVAFVVAAGTAPLSLAAPFVFAYAILVFAHEGGAISRLLKSAPIAFLGLVSYSIYMTHAFVISRSINVATVLEGITGADLMRELPDGTSVVAGGDLLALLALLLIVAATLALSAVTYHLVERPGQRLRLPGERSAPVAASRA